MYVCIYIYMYIYIYIYIYIFSPLVITPLINDLRWGVRL